MARITSGAIQYGVPTNVFAGLATDAEPKSATKNKQKKFINRRWTNSWDAAQVMIVNHYCLTLVVEHAGITLMVSVSTVVTKATW